MSSVIRILSFLGLGPGPGDGAPISGYFSGDGGHSEMDAELTVETEQP